MVLTARVAAAALLASAAWVWMRSAQDAQASDATDWTEIGDDLLNSARNALGMWRAPQRFAQLIADAEEAAGLPAMLLERLLYQESRYRDDIITGRVRSSAGALGIAQFMPATAAQLGIDPLDPAQAIPAAARYLRGLYRTFGNWTEALAAYNWGQGNVARKGLAQAPRETRLYYSQILADVNSTAGTAYA